MSARKHMRIGVRIRKRIQVRLRVEVRIEALFEISLDKISIRVWSEVLAW